MDKNMINIDDLVRLRLSGGEEKERPGAWLAMKDLLDKEMPAATTAVAGYNWRRVFSAAAVLLFLGAASVGGYKLLTNNNGEGGGSSSNSTVAVNEGVKGGGGGIAAGVNNKAVTNTNDEGGQTSGHFNNNNNGNNNIVASTSVTKHNETKKANKVNQNIDKQSTKVNNDGLVAEGGSSSGHVAEGGNTSGNVSANSLKNKKPNHSNRIFASANKLPKSAAKLTKAPGNGDGIAKGTHKGNKDSKIAHKAAPANPAQNVAPPVYSYGGGVSTPTTAVPQLKKQPLDYHKTNPWYVDSANYTYTREKVRRGIRRLDTIDKGMMAMGSGELVSGAAGEANAASAQVNPAAATADNSTTPPAGNYNDYKRSRRSGVQESLWERMVSNAKPDFSNISFHPGLMAGISSTAGQYHMMGAQVGLSGTLNLSERWGILAELKALYRFGNGKSLQNNFNSADPNYRLLPNSGGLYETTIDSQEHGFNIASSSLIELPLAIKYNTGKLNFFAGADFAYNFAVNVEERFGKDYTRTFTGTKEQISGLQDQWKKDNPPVLTTNEFGSRMSIGYMFGAGYQVTPLVGLDLRVSQVFWDNGKTKTLGMYYVSKEMYRAPCFQFNVTYRLQGNRNRPMRAR